MVCWSGSWGMGYMSDMVYIERVVELLTHLCGGGGSDGADYGDVVLLVEVAPP